MLLSLMIALLIVSFLSATCLATPEEDFRAANELYEAREYSKAIDLYLRILDQGEESPALYFNLGNAYFKNGDLGHAILYYLRARRLDPADNDIVSNLEFARSFTRVQMAGVQINPIKSFLESAVEPYRLNTLAWISSLAFVLLFCLLILRFGVGLRNSALRAGIITTLVLLLVFSFVTSFKYRHDYLTSRAVLVAEDCPVRTGPSEQSDIELEAAPGLVVEILSESGDYFNVLFQNKRRGWIRKELIAVV